MSSIVNPLLQTPSNTGGAAGASSAPGSSGSSSAPSNQLTGDSFIQLLTAQLKAQDPLNPIDPTTFVTQLVQFNQLQQLIDINQTLSQPASMPAAGGTQSTNSQGTAAPSAAAARTHLA